MYTVDTKKCPSELKLEPKSGTINSGESTLFTIQLIAKQPINFKSEIRFVLSDTNDTFSVPISGRIMARNLIVLSCSEDFCEMISKIDFGHTFYDTSIVRSAIIFNNCPTTTNFVVILAPQKNGSGINVTRFDHPASLLATSEAGYPPNLEHGDSLPHSRIISISPHQGTLQPFEKRKIVFMFSPIFVSNPIGWFHNRESPYKREYTMELQIVPANPSRTTEFEGQLVELAVKATAEPVELELKENKLELGLCVVNRPYTVRTELTNQSTVLPIKFRIPHVANLVVTPSNGKLEPNSTVPIQIVFTATSIGDIEKSLSILAIGTKKQNPLAKFENKIIHKLKLKLTANCKMTPKPLTPSGPLIATPNDMPRSIKPHDRTISIHTFFTTQKRHTYIDTDYTLTDTQIENRKIHKNRYINFLRDSQSKREDLARDLNIKKFINTQDLGIEPLSGIVPPDIKPPKATQFIPKPPPTQTIKTQSEMVRSITLLDETDLLNNPISSQQRKSVKLPLTPEELISIQVSPTKLDFGEVTINSHKQKQVLITNYNPKLLMFSINGDEHFSYAPRHLLVPDQSETTLSLEFFATKPGVYEQSISYVINQNHTNHFLLTATAVEPYLTISPGTITLTPPSYSSISTGLRRSFSLVNSLNTPIEFYWDFESVDFTDYMIYPTQGVVPSFGELQCEAFCVPHYATPETASVNVSAKNGRESTLNLKLDTGNHDCSFLERRVLFGDIPINLVCIQHCNVYNSGPNNAYFQLGGNFGHLGMIVSPLSGIVPAGGVVKLTIELSAPKQGKFDVPIVLKFKQGSSISIRASGNVLSPIVETDVPLFKFGGVYCGSKSTLHFSLTNKSPVLARLTFDFIDTKDFSISTLKSDKNVLNRQLNLTADVYTLDIPPKSTLKAKLTFEPREISSHDFNLPIFINSEVAHSPPPSPWPPSSNESQTFYLSKIPDIPTPSRRILATSLETPLIVSNMELTFTEPEVFLQTVQVLPTNYKPIKITNTTNRKLKFIARIKIPKNLEKSVFSLYDDTLMPLDAITPLEILSNEYITILVAFSPSLHATFESQISIFLAEDVSKPFATVTLKGNVISPQITVNPPELIITNVPLNIPHTRAISCDLIGYSSTDILFCEIPLLPTHLKLKIVDSKPTEFPRRFRIGTIEPSIDRSVRVSVTVTVLGVESVCLKNSLIFSDNYGNQTVIPFAISVDNCILSLYQFFAFQPTSINFHFDTNSGVPILAPLSDTTSPSPSDSAQTTPNVSTQFSHYETTFSNLDTIFIDDVNSAVCRWLTYHGWPRHYFPIQTPDILGTVDCSSGPFALSIGKFQSKGILEIVQHLWGRPIPDVPVNTLIHYPENERVIYKYQMVTAILAVLQVHGAHLPHISPEILLVQEEYTVWFQKVHNRTPDTSEMERFQFNSSRAWIDILLQTIKVFVLAKVTVNPKFVGKQSNVYSQQELTLLEWMNNNFQTNKHKLVDMIGDKCIDRKIVNFDLDLMDGIVLACCLLQFVPHLKTTHLNHLYLQPQNPEHCLHNASKIIGSLHSIAFDFDLTVSDIIMPNPIFMLLLCTHLFFRLPSYLPKRDISFDGTLTPENHSTTYEVKIENPSKKTLNYAVFIKGEDKEFFTLPKGAHIKVPPKGVIYMPISYAVRFVCEKRAVMFLVGEPGTNHGSILSFNLIGKVSSVIPLRVSKIKALLYKQEDIWIPIDRTGTETYAIDVLEADGSLGAETTKKPIPINLFDESSNCQVNLFTSDGETLTLHSKDFTSLLITLIPFYLGARYCILLFTNPEKGQFVVVVDSFTTLPLPTCVAIPTASDSNRITPDQASAFGISEANADTFLIKSAINEVANEKLTISAKNVALDDALYCLAHQNMSPSEYKYRMLTNSMPQAILEIATRALGISTEPTNSDKPPCNPRMTFSITSNSENFRFPPSITLPPTESADLPFQFTASVAGQYKCRVVLKNSHEIRVYQILSLVVPSEIHPVIQMECPALKTVTQQIPVLNPSKREWILAVTLKGIGYTGPNVFVIRALETAFYPLSYRPTIPGHFNGEVFMTNRETGTEHHFSIIGRSLVPESMGEIVIGCRVGEQQTCAISVPNYSERTANFKASTNIEFSTGHSVFSVDPNSIITYELLLTPKHRGTYTGTIIFMADAPLGHVSPRFNNVDHPDGTSHRVWYTLKVFVSPSEPKDIISLSQPLFTKNIIGIEFQNPWEQSGFCAAICVDGEGLTGPSQMELTPLESCVINLTFSPIRKGTQEANVILTDPKSDEIWYKLELTGIDPVPIVCPIMESPLGDESSLSVLLCNPLDVTTEYSWEISKSDHFYVLNQSERISVPPRGEIEIIIQFKPSTLGEGSHFATLYFESVDLGVLSYHLKGVGVAPGEMSPLDIYSDIGSNAARVLHFKNPLDIGISVDVALIESTNETISILLTNPKHIPIPPKGNLDIPLRFTPRQMCPVTQTLTISAVTGLSAQPLVWSCPIKGHPTSHPIQLLDSALLQSASRVRTEVCVILRPNQSESKVAVFTSPTATTHSAITDTPIEVGKVKFRIMPNESGATSSSLKAFLDRSLGVKFLGAYLETTEGSGNGTNLAFHLIFFPYKAMNTKCVLEVEFDGCLWKIGMQLSATHPEPDDTINIRAKQIAGSPTTVFFNLTSGCDESKPFNAYLDKHSDLAFSISPVKGVLPPRQTGTSTKITVSYRPVKYGTESSGLIIIETDNMLWTYKLKGATITKAKNKATHLQPPELQLPPILTP